MSLVVGESHGHARVERRMNEHNVHDGEDGEDGEDRDFDPLNITPTSYSLLLCPLPRFVLSEFDVGVGHGGKLLLLRIIRKEGDAR